MHRARKSSTKRTIKIKTDDRTREFTCLGSKKNVGIYEYVQRRLPRQHGVDELYTINKEVIVNWVYSQSSISLAMCNTRRVYRIIEYENCTTLGIYAVAIDTKRKHITHAFVCEEHASCYSTIRPLFSTSFTHRENHSVRGP